jgi:hypothetical protein
MTSSTGTPESRAAAIRQAAIVRAALGQAASHRLLPDGRHQVVLRGGTCYTVGTLDQAIDRAMRREEAAL